MQVNHYSYLFALAILFIVSLGVRSPRPRQVLFLLFSYLFYATWGWQFLLVLVLSTLLNFAWGLVLRRDPSASKLAGGVLLNVAVLLFFKYLPPLAASWGTSALAHSVSRILMPVGISFWTFQGLSHLFDRYREEELDASLLEFALYMAFWPTVLSGPVCRLPDMLPQFRDPRRVDWENVSEGARRIALGLFMKVVLAQILQKGFVIEGEGVDYGFDQVPGGWGGLDVWALAIGYGFQLFFDFAGYSNIVIGSARLFGLRLAENFDRPFLSTSVSQFWTRWHMSLSFWIRDYVFLPLATVRREVLWPQAALVISMVVFGLWHAGALTFLAWGFYHGLLLAGHRVWQRRTRGVKFPLGAPFGTALAWAATLGLISLGWIFFRAHSLGQALRMLSAIVNPRSYAHLVLRADFYIVAFAICAGYFVVAGLDALFVSVERPAFRRLVWFCSPAYYAGMIFLWIAWSRAESIFIYFQF